MNQEERELVKLTINRGEGASPFWPQHRHQLCGCSVVAPVWYAALAATVAAALAAALADAFDDGPGRRHPRHRPRRRRFVSCLARL